MHMLFVVCLLFLLDARMTCLTQRVGEVLDAATIAARQRDREIATQMEQYNVTQLMILLSSPAVEIEFFFCVFFFFFKINV